MTSVDGHRHQDVRTAPVATRLAVAALALAVVAGGCSDGARATRDPDVATTTAPPAAAAPAPSPLPTHQPVSGERAPTGVDIRPLGRLDAADRAELDETAIQAFATAVFDALDAHLTDLQAGGAGTLSALDADGVLAADPNLAELAGPALTDPMRPVRAARYDLIAYHDVTVAFAHLTATVTDAEAAVRTVGFTLAAGPSGAPVLVAVDDGVPAEVAP